MTRSQPTLSLPLLPRKAVAVDFVGGELSSDGGWLLLALLDQKLQFTERMAGAIQDPRREDRVQHALPALLRQRIYQIAQGYQDANDAQTLRHDPLLKGVITWYGRTVVPGTRPCLVVPKPNQSSVAATVRGNHTPC